MSTIKVDTIATRTGSGNITASNTIAGNITGNVTGNVTGDTTGTHTGNIATNSITTQSGTDITIPTGKKLVVTDTGGVNVPGSIVQVKHSIYSAWTTTTSSNWGQVGLNCSITPTSTSNDLLINITAAGLYMQNSGDIIGFRLYKGGVLVDDLDHACRHVTGGNGGNAAYSFRETASSTSSLTYQLWWRGNTSGSGYAIGINNYAGVFGTNNGTKSSMTIMEIAG